MISFVTRLWRDPRGNVLAIVAAAIPLVVGSAGLATDTIQWVTWKRELQRAADSAAFAGAYAKAQGAATANNAVNRDLAKHNNSGITLVSGYPTIAYPTQTGWTSAVRVELAIQKPLGFSSLFVSAAPTITAGATAALVDDGTYCLVALDSSTASAVTIGGNANANLGCGVISNSTSASDSVGVNGNSYNLTASPVAGAGGMPTASLTSHGASNIQPFHAPLPDPYAGQYDTTIPGSVTCRANINASGARDGSGNVNPGCYNDFNPGNGTTNLNPGVYYLNNTGLSINGNTTITGNGVTLIFTGTSPGTLSMNGNAVLNLTAPTTATCGVLGGVDSCNFKKMLMIQSSNASSGNTNRINGNSGAKLDGAIYFPKGNLDFRGNSGPATKCAMIVALRVDFGGSTDIQNNTTGCAANSTVAGKKMRLVA